MTAMTPPAPTVAAPTTPVNRVQLATDTFQNIAAQRAPEANADIRDEIRNSSALGQIASGGLRTRVGNLKLARERDLDALQKDLSLKAAEGSIADASTAYQQALASSQQQLAGTIGLGQLGVAQGGLELEKERAGLDAALARANLTGVLDGEQTLAAKQQAVQEAVARGSLSAQEGQLALARLAQEQGNTREGERLQLAREAQEQQGTQFNAQLAEQTATRLQQSGQFTAQLAEQVAARLQNKSLEDQRRELDRLVADRTLTVQQAQLAEQVASRTQQNTQFGLQLAQQATQFGATQAQQLALAQLADATQNRQIDVATAQGKNTLLVELARIMAGPNGTVPAEAVRALAAAMGLELPEGFNMPVTGSPPTSGPAPRNDGPNARPDDRTNTTTRNPL